jgi:cob(I)alamin adenosyltransferase
MSDTFKYIGVGLFGLVTGASIFGLVTVYGRYQEANSALNACNQECTARLSEYAARLERAKEDRASLVAEKERVSADLEAKVSEFRAEIDRLRSERDAVSQAILARLDAIAQNIELGQAKASPAESPRMELPRQPGTEQERGRLERQGNRDPK